MKTQINFGGFYHTHHDDIVDQGVAMSLDCYDYELGEVASDKLYDTATSEDWKNAQIDYCSQYVDMLNNELNTVIKVNSLDSPREYNFSTDVILANITRKDVLKLFKYVRDNDLKSELVENSERKTTSVSGYIPYYSYSDFFKVENRYHLVEALLDVIIDMLGEDYPFMVEDFYR